MTLELRQGGAGTTIVRIDDWPDLNRELTLTSSAIRVPPDHARWLDTDANLISSRLRRVGNDRSDLTGQEKGRVIYLYRDQAFQGRPPVAAALIHIDGKRHLGWRKTPITIRLRRIVVVAEAKGDMRKSLAYTAEILACMHALSEAAGNADGRFEWIFDNKEAAADAIKIWGIKKPMKVVSPLGQGKTQMDRSTVSVRRCLR